MKFKSIPPTGPQMEFRTEVLKVFRKHGEKLSAEELLAVMSYTVGQLLALQDQRTMTPERGLTLIGRNIEEGNADAINACLNSINDLPV